MGQEVEETVTANAPRPLRAFRELIQISHDNGL
jgi:hypothetical protein